MFADTVAYAVFGPVMYDESFADTLTKNKLNLAMHWTAHDPNNEGMADYRTESCKNYDDYARAIKSLIIPDKTLFSLPKRIDNAIVTRKISGRWNGGVYM